MLISNNPGECLSGDDETACAHIMYSHYLLRYKVGVVRLFTLYHILCCYITTGYMTLIRKLRQVSELVTFV